MAAPYPTAEAGAPSNPCPPSALKATRGLLTSETPTASAKPPHKKKRAKRIRGQKAKNKVVAAIGEEPRQRTNRKGKVRQLDIFRRGDREETMSRNQREFVMRMGKYRGTTSASEARTQKGGGNADRMENDPKLATIRPGKSAEREKDVANVEGKGAGGAREGRTSLVEKEQMVAGGAVEAANLRRPSEKRKFGGMQPGENFAQFSGRLKRESKQMILDAAKKGNHQREKKRAYYEKRKEAAMRRRKRNRGTWEGSDGDDEDLEGEALEEMAHLPGYWQEILRNNGRPLSKKQRRRRERTMRDEVDEVAFGEQVERPPNISILPVRRGRQS